MKYLIGNVWRVKNNFDGCVIPLNLCVKYRPHVPDNKYSIFRSSLYSQYLRSLYYHSPELLDIISNNLVENGNKVFSINNEYIGFPVRKEVMCSDIKIRNRIPPLYRARYPTIDFSTIERSCEELILLLDDVGWKKILIIRPESPEAYWIDIKKIMQKHFDDRFNIIKHFSIGE